jgi:hypothetical protein
MSGSPTLCELFHARRVNFTDMMFQAAREHGRAPLCGALPWGRAAEPVRAQDRDRPTRRGKVSLLRCQQSGCRVRATRAPWDEIHVTRAPSAERMRAPRSAGAAHGAPRTGGTARLGRA